jgi:hypothetical protein
MKMDVAARVVLAAAVLLYSPWGLLHADDAPDDAGCPQRPLAMDVDHLRQDKDVQAVSVNASRTSATVLFVDGDVLRVGTIGCVKPSLSARLWVANDEGLTDDAWLSRARSVATRVLEPGRAAQLTASLASGQPVTHVDGGLKVQRALADGAGYSLTVVRTPYDGLGTSMSLVVHNL